MSNPSTLELLHKHMFRNEKIELTSRQKRQLERYEAAFTIWLDKPYMPRRKLRNFLQKKFNISQSQAYEDIKNLQILFGQVDESSKEWYRYLANELTLSAVADCDKKKADLRNAAFAKIKIMAAKALVEINRLNQVDADPVDWKSIEPQNFQITNDPQQIKGWEKKMTRDQLHNKQEELIKKYAGDSEITEVEYEELSEQ